MRIFVPECNKNDFEGRSFYRERWVNKKMDEWNKLPEIIRMAKKNPKRYLTCSANKKEELRESYDNYNESHGHKTHWKSKQRFRRNPSR